MSDIDFWVIPEAVVPPTPVPVEDCSGVLTPTTLLPWEVVVKGVVYTKPCPWSNDVEVVCATNDGGETIIKAVAIINQSSGASTLTDFSGTVLTGYVVVPCSETSQVIEWEVWCDGWVNIIPFYETETNGTPSASIAFWFNPLTNSIVVPSWSQTPWACTIDTPSVQIVEQNLVPINSDNNPVGYPIKEVRTYTDGVLTATDYVNTVTGATETLPVGTFALVEEQRIQKSTIEMCDNWVTFLRHYFYGYGGNNSLLGFTDSDKDLNPYTPSGAETIWACVLPTASTTLLSGGASIAEGIYSATLGPDGTSWTNPGNLKSVTILARKSNTTDAIPWSGANQVMINTTDRKIVLLTGESITFSVEDGNIQDLGDVQCLVDSAALVIYNRL